MGVSGRIRGTGIDRVGYKRLTNGLWLGHACVIVGGGTSVTIQCIDTINRLIADDHIKCISINNSYNHVRSHANVSLDGWWLGKTAYTQSFIEYTGYKVQVDNDILGHSGLNSVPPDIINLPVYEQPNQFSPDILCGLGHGGNSGFPALNLALCLGCTPIILAGYDMCCTHDSSGTCIAHYYEDGAARVKKYITTHADQWIDIYQQAIQKLPTIWYNTDIWNMSDISRLDCFPKCTIDDLPDILEGIRSCGRQ